MKVLFDREAENELAQQLDYLISQEAAPAARRLEQRLSHYIETTIARYPRSGRFIQHRGLWETWVPRTRIVIWYRFTIDELQIVRIWHAAQNRERT